MQCLASSASALAPEACTILSLCLSIATRERSASIMGISYRITAIECQLLRSKPRVKNVQCLASLASASAPEVRTVPSLFLSLATKEWTASVNWCRISAVEGQPIHRKPLARDMQYLASAAIAPAPEACTKPSSLSSIRTRERIASVLSMTSRISPVAAGQPLDQDHNQFRQKHAGFSKSSKCRRA